VTTALPGEINLPTVNSIAGLGTLLGTRSRLKRRDFFIAAEMGCSVKRALGGLLALLAMGACVCAQGNVPIISGAVAFNASTIGGATTLQPSVDPVLVAPFGDHWLVESRAGLLGFFSQQNGTSGPYNGQFFATLDYLQVDYIANPHLTVTVGRFLTPFNIYNERFSAVWIANLQDSPVIFTIGTRTSSSSNGGMLRGVVVQRPNWLVNYTAYFSVLNTTENLQAGRAAGGRIGLFLPTAGVEVGASYQRFLQDRNYNAAGTYFAWQPPQTPLDVRAEYAHSLGGQGYWLEAAMHLANSRADTTWLGRLQTVARVQQFFKGVPTPQDILPSVDVNQFDVGLNYYLPHDVRVNASYGRQYSSAGNANIWNFQIAYRFLFPALPGESK
jgi:hypothetical protein